MRRPRHRAAALAAALALGLGLVASACSDDGDEDGAGAATTAPATSAPATTAAPEPATTAAPEPEPAPPPEPLPGLPADTAGFEDWTRLNADPIPQDSPQAQRVGFDAHGGTKNVYVNQPRGALQAGSGPREFPDGSIVVKAAGAGGDITLVAIMRKMQGQDPAHGDWEFVEYKRGGGGEEFATDASLRDGTCWGCHAVAEESDWVFTALD